MSKILKLSESKLRKIIRNVLLENNYDNLKGNSKINPFIANDFMWQENGNGVSKPGIEVKNNQEIIFVTLPFIDNPTMYKKTGESRNYSIYSIVGDFPKFMSLPKIYIKNY